MSVKLGGMDPSLLALVAICLEKALNESLQYDPASKQRLTQLEQKHIAILFSDLTLVVRLRVENKHAYLALLPESELDDNKADLTLRGELQQFKNLASDKKHSLAGSGIHAEGELALLQALADIASDVDIDWQDMLSAKIGPELSSAASIAFKSLKQVLPSFNKKESQAHLENLLHSEWRLLPHPEEVLFFQASVQELRRDSERLEARLQQLKNTVIKD
ncbi:ubiquinone biosynthesis accessory factor UbiJ [Agaribacterium haliotis]|uniref:ubiquinone biosynthesis accessory factor UbiJ n=1 Tax=Agaribacterium haliotis TaxID=2013869 RepID=UPI000BB55925|nr:SCP2 sterol-binding domain-containing protein [Agaribacterium haliotis]